MLGLMLAQRLQCWAEIKTTVGECLVFAGSKHKALGQFWPMLVKRWDSVGDTANIDP